MTPASEGYAMWGEVLKVIEQLVRQQALSVARVNEVLGVTMALAEPGDETQEYHAQIPGDGPFREVGLRLTPARGIAVVILEANPDSPLVVTGEDLRVFGDEKGVRMDPRIPPEGGVTSFFDVRGMELRVGYSAKSRRLSAVSLLQQPPAPPAAAGAHGSSPV